MKTLFTLPGVTSYSSTDVNTKGSFQEAGDQLYQWVYNAGAVAARAGGPACYDASNIGESDFLQDCLPDAADADVNFFAGIWMSAVPAESYGWILVKGTYATGKLAPSTTALPAAGDQLIPSTATDTTGTGASRAFALLNGIDISDSITTATGYATILNALLIAPCCICLDAVTDTGTATDTVSANIFVRGLMR